MSKNFATDGELGEMPIVVLKEWADRTKTKRLKYQILVESECAATDVDGVFLREANSDKFIRYTNCRLAPLEDKK